MTSPHSTFMHEALKLARINLGQTWPNPSVGAVIVQDNQIIGRGTTQRGGRPHAEVMALQDAGAAARSATLYVTLEPCAHHGKTPPCVDAIIAAGIQRCVIACRDPHPHVNGQGIATLKAAGIEVIEGVKAEEGEEINQGFFSWVTRKRPFIAMKIATSTDGKIAYPAENSGGIKQWITGDKARNEVHKLRSQYDAILTGIGTVLADDPLLTCRISGLEDKSPVRVVLDRRLRIPSHSQLVQTADQVPVWIIHHRHPRECGDLGPHVQTLEIPAQGGDDELHTVIRLLANKGITRLLVEAGQGINTAFMQAGLVDRLYWFKAPHSIGGDGLAVFADNEKTLNILANWNKVGYHACPPDTLEIIEPCLPAS